MAAPKASSKSKKPKAKKSAKPRAKAAKAKPRAKKPASKRAVSSTSAAPTPTSPARGIRPGDRFGTQVRVLANVYRTHALVAKVGDDEFSAEEIEQLAEQQIEDEAQDEALYKAYTEYHVPFTARAVARAKRFGAALKAAKGLLASNPTALSELRAASFNRGNPRSKKSDDDKKNGDTKEPEKPST